MVMAGPAASTIRRSRVVAAALACSCLLAGCQTFESMKYRVKNLRLSSSYEDPEAET
jgi:outer membrane murein-binding lipoprotein Lpp